ncbi:MAG TPA: tetratricopeptide repeat protein [Xanthobacteraceae bacterium]
MKKSALFIAAVLVAGAPVAPSNAADDSQLCRQSTDAGIAACERAIASHKLKGRNLAFIYLNRGQTYYERNDYDRAIADFTRAIEVDPTYPMGYNNRANSWHIKGDEDRAIASYDQTIRLDPNYTAAFTGRGLAYEKKGNIEQARRDYNAALAVPQKYDDGKWAHETATTRLKALDEK